MPYLDIIIISTTLETSWRYRGFILLANVAHLCTPDSYASMWTSAQLVVCKKYPDGLLSSLHHHIQIHCKETTEHEKKKNRSVYCQWIQREHEEQAPSSLKKAFHVLLQVFQAAKSPLASDPPLSVSSDKGENPEFRQRQDSASKNEQTSMSKRSKRIQR